MSRLDGRTILVTGAARGIGASYARAVAAAGARVALCDVLDCGPVADAIRTDGGEAWAGVCDITDGAALASMVTQIETRLGPVDGLVANAAVFAALTPGPFEDIPAEEFDRVLRVNVRGTFECIRAVLPGMRRRGYGKIVTIASGTVFKGTPGLLHYTASKGAVIAMTRVVAREAGVDGIRVNCVAPGFVPSEGIRDAQSTQGINRATIASRCLPREQAPEDLDGAVTFLLSAQSDFMTGQTMVVDGGSVMH